METPAVERSQTDFGSAPNDRRRLLSSSSLSSNRIINKTGEDLGKVRDLMIDIVYGRVGYVVLSFGGVLGIGDKLFAVPWDKITVDEDREALVLDVTRAVLEQAPGFEKDNWPDMADLEWGSQIHAYYEVSPYWQYGSERRP
ncbi:MAG: PRC-barrel domain-containing protein [Bryobacteraceae bacterium]|nr:PRC-barrel domain-containing protein [Bryobacteraceae bacterium]